MKKSAELMRRVEQEVLWGGGLWFLWGISFAVGKWLDINALKTDKTGALMWFGFGGLVALAEFILGCTRAVLAAIRENTQAD